MFKKRIISCMLSAFMLAGCVSCLSLTAFASETVTKTFKDDFNKGVTAETANASTGEYYRTDGLYSSSNNVTGFVKITEVSTTAKYAETPYKYAALTSNVLKDTEQSTFIIYHAEGGITGFNFAARFKGGNTTEVNYWGSDILVDISGNVEQVNRLPLVYVSANGTDWVNPYNNELGYKISYYWPSGSEKDTVYSGWTHLRCKSTSIPEGMKYMKIIFPWIQWKGATQIDDLNIDYNYTPSANERLVEKNVDLTNTDLNYTCSISATATEALSSRVYVGLYKAGQLVGANYTDADFSAYTLKDDISVNVTAAEAPDSMKVFYWNNADLTPYSVVPSVEVK